MTRLLALLVFAAPALAAGPHADTLMTPDAWEKVREAQKLASEGDALHKKGKQAEAAAMRARALGVIRDVYGSIPSGDLVSMEQMASEMVRDGQTEPGREVRRAVERTYAGLYGEDDWRTAWSRMVRREAEVLARLPAARREAWWRAESLQAEGTRHHAAGDYDKALAAAREALAARRKAVGGDDFRTGGMLSNIGSLMQDLGRPAEGLGPARRGVEIQRSILGEGHPDTAVSMNNLGTLMQGAGDHEGARPLVARAVDVLVRTRGPSYPFTVRCMINLVGLDHNNGVRADTPRRAREAVAAARLLGDGGRELSKALALLSAVLHEAVGAEAAVPPLEEAVTLLGRLVGARHPELAAKQVTLARLYAGCGRLSAAVALGQGASERLAASLGRRHPEYADSLLTLSTFQWRMGDGREAVRLAGEATRALAASLGRRHVRYAQALSLTAIYLEGMGRHRDAMGPAREALAVYEGWKADGTAKAAEALSLIGSLHSRLGEEAEAKKAFREALRRLHGGAARDRLRVLNDLGGHELEQGRTLEALHWLAQAEAAGRRAGPGNVQYQAVLSNIALAWHVAGRDDLARQFAGRYLTAPPRPHETPRVERMLAQAGRVGQSMMSLRLGLDGAGEVEGYRHLLEKKGEAFATQQHRLRAARGKSARGRELAEEMAGAATEISRLQLEGTTASREKARALERKRERLELELAELAGVPSRPAEATPAALAAALPEGVALADFAWALQVRRGDGPAASRVERRLHAFVTRRGAGTVRIDLGPSGPLAEAAAAWRRKIRSGADAATEGRDLRRLLWEPLEGAVKDAPTVLLSLEAELAGLPFGALPGSKPGTCLIEERRFAVVPLPRGLLEARLSRGPGASLLAAGGVDFARRVPGAAPGVWATLPATLREAKAAAAGFRRRHPEGEVSLLSGSKATADAVRAGLARHTHAHLATHGWAAPARPGGRGLLERQADGAHPGLRAGVVLAGGGLLTALEVASLDLSRLDLAVLSACETGLGAEGGEGVLGLQRAFQSAGCRSVVASLWSVDDAATSVLMERFYFHLWTKGRSTLEALHQAQLDVLRGPDLVEGRVALLRKELGESSVRGVGKEPLKLPGGARRSPPVWWGAFVLSGDWR